MHDHDTDPITARLRAEGDRLRRRILLSTLIPVAAAIVLIFVTSRQVSTARTELELLQDSAVQLRQEVDARLETLVGARQEADSLATQVAALKAWVEQRSMRVADSIQRSAGQQFATAGVAPRIYIHIGEAGQRTGARALQRQLEAQGFVVPGIELVSRMPRRSEVRFFKDEERAGADRIREIASAAGVTLTVNDLSARYQTSAAIRPGHYEIWLGPDFPAAQARDR